MAPEVAVVAEAAPAPVEVVAAPAPEVVEEEAPSRRSSAG